jgi:hypothetical protein
MLTFFHALRVVLAVYWPIPAGVALFGGIAIRNHLHENRKSSADQLPRS